MPQSGKSELLRGSQMSTVRSLAKSNLALTPFFGLPAIEKSLENLPAETEKIQLKNLKAQQKKFLK